MTQLTKEHLDKALDKHFKKVDQRFEKMDRRFEAIEANMATKDDLTQLAAMVQRGFQEMSRKLDVREDVDKLKHQMRQVRQSIGLRN